MIGIQPGSFRSALHVIMQFALIALIYLTGLYYPRNKILLALYAAFIILALWAMYLMKFRFNISPEPLNGMKVVSGGPYRFIRHPMYTSLLGATACLVTEDFSAARFLYWIFLAVNMCLKLTYEEKILTGRFPEYAEYIKKTKRLIPFIF
ncbi:MAG: isoprenylcysteine carboxylmethyltransferase family protein [Bacteroidetes bacterium]|nr:isoprenylcysteine carboxylmethyltransferase family protein [Bacteroidota bacterium]